MKKILYAFFIMMVLFFGSETADAAITKAPNNLGLVGYWSFDEGTSTIAHDFSGNRNHGTFSGIANPPTATSGWGPGRQRSGMRFDPTDGTEDYVQINSTLGITQFPFSMAAWIKTASTTSAGQVFALTLSSSGSTRMGIRMVNGTACISRTNAAQECGSTIVADNQWHHAVVVYESSTSRILYIDGRQYASTSIAYNFPAIDRAAIGCEWDSGCGSNFIGTIDEVRMYSRALSAAEVAALYNSGAAKFNSTRTDVLTNGLVGHWTFDGKDTNWGTGKTNDISGQLNHGTVTNMSTTTTPAQGKNGQAIRFDGVDDKVLFTSTDYGTVHTIAFWIYGLATNPGVVAGRTNAANTVAPWFLSSSGNKIRYYTSGVTIPEVDHGGVMGGWNHFIITRDGDSIVFYKNGQSIGSGSLTSGSALQIDEFGARGSSNFLTAILDDYRIYNRVLTAPEIVQLYRMSSDTKQNVTASTTPALANGLVGYWTFDGKHTNWATNKTNDQSGQGNHSIIANMSTTTSPTQGIMGQGLKFDNADDYVNAGSASMLDDLGPLSVSVWTKPNSYGEASQAQIVNKAGTGGSGWYLSQLITGSTIRFFVNYSTTGLDVRGSNSHTTADFGKWTHWVATWDGTTNASGARIYKNGTEITYTTQIDGVGTRSSDAASSLLIGNLSGSNRTFDGDMDEVRLYNRVLTAAEIRQLYNMGR